MDNLVFLEGHGLAPLLSELVDVSVCETVSVILLFLKKRLDKAVHSDLFFFALFSLIGLMSEGDSGRSTISVVMTEKKLSSSRSPTPARLLLSANVEMNRLPL